MATTHICDICGKTLSLDSVKSVSIRKRIDIDKVKAYDVCGNCREKLFNVIESGFNNETGRGDYR